MTDTGTQHSDDEALRKVLRSCKPDTAPPQGCKERVFARVMAYLESKGRAEGSLAGKKHRYRLPVVVLSGASAAAAIVLVCFWILGLGVRTASADFGEMLRRVREVTSVAYDVTVQAPDQPRERAHVLNSLGRTRLTWASGAVNLIDENRETVLSLSRISKEARFGKLVDQIPPQYDLLRWLSAMKETAGTRVGHGVVGQREADIFHVTVPRGSMRIWVDREEELPLRVEARTPVGSGRESLTILESFRWDPPFDESAFSLEVPPDYTLKQADEEPSEADLVRTLRICAEKSRGTFPAKLNAQIVLRIVLPSREQRPQHTVDLGDSAAMTYTYTDLETRNALRQCIRGLAFVEQVREKGTWSYVGAGVRLGDAQAEVCSWVGPGSEIRRVIYGDLRGKDVRTTTAPSKDEPAPDLR
ncbi:MAG TPA: hypothetical protein VNA25_30985 [Phycisphaerae bacterium]|nr:hypothetical protein [Phycisphaerae bacterium]